MNKYGIGNEIKRNGRVVESYTGTRERDVHSIYKDHSTLDNRNICQPFDLEVSTRRNSSVFQTSIIC